MKGYGQPISSGGTLMAQSRRHRWIITLALLGVACGSPFPPPPETAQDPVVDTMHGVVFTDPYRWLEDQDSPETRAWIAEQNAYSEQIVGESALRAGLEARLRELMDVPGVVYPQRHGDYEYFAYRKPGREVGAIYRRTAPDEPDDVPLDVTADYEVVVDPLDLRADGTTSVGIQDFSRDGRLMLYSIRDGGPDEIEVRVRDLESGEDLPDRLPRALYSSVAFTTDGTGFYFTHRSRQTGPRVRRHVLGTDMSEDVELFGAGIGPTAFVNASEVDEGRYLIYTVQHGWARTDVYLHDLSSGGDPMPLVVGAPARFRARWVDGEIYLLTNLNAPLNRVVAVRPDALDPSQWREVIPEADDLLTGYQRFDGDFVADYLRNVSSRIVRYARDGTVKDEIPIPEHHVASFRGHVAGRALLSVTSLLTPQTVLQLDLETMETEEWRPSTVPFDGSAYEMKQVWYTSADETEAPMYVAHRRGLELDGATPTLLYGYGGFNVNLMPRFDARAAVWMEQGGVYAMATLRGGGEFGEEWHRDGMLENKPNVFADFIAAAEWLVANGYTSPDRLAIRGASNGGLLVGSALTKRPDLFRAVFAGLPELDLVRFYQFTETNNMPALLEYGNGAVREEFEVLRTFSPYQNVRDGVDYPAVMLTQGDLDTRVPPLQARKMAARLQAATSSGLPVILDYNARTGHAGGRTFSRNVRNAAMELAFLLQQLGAG
ncbi:MAG: S9 family peptidase [Gammaproteobacteria bacterium]|nr:S9 family peptidase [Gammaproteobacteria bacterium]